MMGTHHDGQPRPSLIERLILMPPRVSPPFLSVRGRPGRPPACLPVRP